MQGKKLKTYKQSKETWFFVLFFCVITNVSAQLPLGIELGMPVNQINDLFVEPQYYEQFTGTSFGFEPESLINKSDHVFKNYKESNYISKYAYSPENAIFFRDGIVIGLLLQSDELIAQEMIGKAGSGNLILAEWNRYIDEFTKRWGKPVTNFPTFPIITNDNRVIRNYDVLFRARLDENDWKLEAVFPNGMECKIIRFRNSYIGILFTWGEIAW
jgi:hypothetical protein